MSQPKPNSLSIILPGHCLQPFLKSYPNHKLIFGPGLNPKTLKACRPGILKSIVHESSDTVVFYVDTNNKRYLDLEIDDIVVGIVASRTVDYLKVDIGTAEYALLKLIDFQGATKRAKPEIYPGDIVVAKIKSETCKSSEAFLTCVNSRTGKSDGLGVITGGGNIERPGILSGMVAATQVHNVTGLTAASGKGKNNNNNNNSEDQPYEKSGETKKGSECDGFGMWLPLTLCRRLLVPNNVILSNLGKHFSFEIAVGINGYVWLNGGTLEKTLSLLTALESFQYLDDDVVEEYMKNFEA